MSTVTTASAQREHRVTVRSLASRKRKAEFFTMLTAYDFTFARIFDEAGVDVLLVGGGDDVKIGTPLVDGARVTGTITAQARHPKIRVFKMKRRKGYKRTQGHRQAYTEIRVDDIQG